MLDKVKIVELCEMVAGPYCGKLLASLGADLVKVERPGKGDPARWRGPFPDGMPHAERSALFLYLNTSKRGITLDLERATGRAIFHQLLRWADLLLIDLAPGEMEQRELSYSYLRELNPKLIVTSITPFGLTGPYRDFKAYELNVVHGAGSGYLMPTDSTFPDREPLKAGGYFDDGVAGLTAALASLAALYWRSLSGEGQLVDISRQEAAAALDRVELVAFLNEGRNPHRIRKMPGGVIPCKDGYVTIAMGQENQWENLVRLMGNPELARDERFRDRGSRTNNADPLNQIIREWASSFTRMELYHRAQAGGVPSGAVNTVPDLLEDPHYRARGLFMEIEHPEAGRLPYPAAPYHLSPSPRKERRPAPLLGQHNEEVLGGLLGYSRAQQGKLRETSVI